MFKFVGLGVSEIVLLPVAELCPLPEADVVVVLFTKPKLRFELVPPETALLHVYVKLPDKGNKKFISKKTT